MVRMPQSTGQESIIPAIVRSVLRRVTCHECCAPCLPQFCNNLLIRRSLLYAVFVGFLLCEFIIHTGRYLYGWRAKELQKFITEEGFEWGQPTRLKAAFVMLAGPGSGDEIRSSLIRLHTNVLSIYPPPAIVFFGDDVPEAEMYKLVQSLSKPVRQFVQTLVLHNFFNVPERVRSGEVENIAGRHDSQWEGRGKAVAGRAITT